MIIKVENGAGFNSNDKRDPKSWRGIQDSFEGKTRNGNSKIDITRYIFNA